MVISSMRHSAAFALSQAANKGCQAWLLRTFFSAADMLLDTQPSKSSAPKAPKNPKFGKVFTDHMLVIEHDDGVGWSKPRIVPFADIKLHPAAQVLHYGMSCFEGMKAYRGVDGQPRLFRPDMNMRRLHLSSRRLAFPDYNPEELMKCIVKLLHVDLDWLPPYEDHSLYIRPFMFASSDTLGVQRAAHTTIATILCPVGPYFPSGMKPVQLFVEEQHVRAWLGGVGNFKMGGNYAPTILPQTEAMRDHGCQQVVYTMMMHDCNGSRAVISESGAMNMFFAIRSNSGDVELVTPPLDATILPGVTRDSILALCREWGTMKVSERAITVEELCRASSEGRLLEVFGAGTACVVQPVAGLKRANGDVLRPQCDYSDAAASAKSIAYRVRRQLEDIHYGRTPHTWSVPF